MKEKYYSKSDVAKLYGLTATTLANNGIYGLFTNHSPSDKYAMYAESEVLAMKADILAELEKNRQEKRKQAGQARRGKKRTHTVKPKDVDAMFEEFGNTLKKLNRLYRKMSK